MGTDKALLRLGNRTVIERIADEYKQDGYEKSLHDLGDGGVQKILGAHHYFHLHPFREIPGHFLKDLFHLRDNLVGI